MVWQVKALAAKLVTCVQIYDPYSEGGEPIPVVCPLIHVTCMHTHTHTHTHTQRGGTYTHTHTHTERERERERERKYWHIFVPMRDHGSPSLPAHPTESSYGTS